MSIQVGAMKRLSPQCSLPRHVVVSRLLTAALLRPRRRLPKPHGRRLLHRPKPCGSSPGRAHCCTAGRRLGYTSFRVAVRVGHSSNTPAGPICVELHGKAIKSSVLLMGPSSSMIRERELAVASCPAPCLVGVQRHLLWLLVLLLEEKKDVLGSQ